MLEVKFTGLDGGGDQAAKGSVVLLGGKAVPKFDDRTLADSVMAEPVETPGGTLTAEASPEAWMRALCTKYKSAYLMASKATSDGTEGKRHG